MKELLPNLLFFYGVFLISCGIIAVVFIGLKAKTALISGGTSGCIVLLTGYFQSEGFEILEIAGLIFALALSCVFSWRVTKTLYALFEMIRTNHPDLKAKGIAFLIIGIMAIVSIIVVGLQFAILL